MRTPKSELERKQDNVRGRQVLRQISGKAVRPYRNDGYANLLNKYGTSQDNSEAYKYEREPIVADMQLTSLYESNGLFSKIIDTPSEEAVKHGFTLNISNKEIDNFIEKALDDLEWEEKAATAIKWARLYGGSIIVMLINDGRGLEEPVDWENIESVDELRVYERAIVQPDYSSLYKQDFGGGKHNRTSRFGEPEYYNVNSMYGSFTVHESRCLVFRNGVLPEQISNTTYQIWGMPEYIRIKRALRETVTAHSDATKLLERSVQAIYSMKNLAQLLATDDGENQVVKRLEVIDMARGLLNSIAIDAEGESYDFKSISFSGVKDVIDSTCNMLSALTSIPQTILFGRSPAGMNATGDSDLENYYNFVERIQKLMLKKNLRYLMDLLFRAGVASGELNEEPDYKLQFNPLWSLSDSEQAAIEQQRAATAMTKAQTAQIYVDMQALDPTEVRQKLASDDEFDVEDIIDEEDDDIFSSLFENETGKIESDTEAVKRNYELNKAAGGTEQSATSIAEPDVLPENNTDSVQVPSDILYREKFSNNEIEKFLEKDLPKRKKSAIIIEEDMHPTSTAEQIIPKNSDTINGDIGNENSGRYPKGSGESNLKDPKAAKEFTKQLKGTVAQNGVALEAVSSHAAYRMKERGITVDVVKDCLTTAPLVFPGNKKHKDATCFQKDTYRLVYSKNGVLITAENLEDDDD